jgi:hypothetical protein
MKLHYMILFIISGSFLLASNSRASELLELTSAEATTVSGLWWNPDESGWGVSITQQEDTIFAVIFAYDRNGFSTWYVASNCVITGGTCEGEVYEVTGGSEISEEWNGDNKILDAVGSVHFDFDSIHRTTMSMTVDGQLIVKQLIRQIFRSSPGMETFCLDEQRGVAACTADYSPVCATVEVQCITTPCDPVKETFSNSCNACTNDSTVSYVNGECSL